MTFSTDPCPVILETMWFVECTMRKACEKWWTNKEKGFDLTKLDIYLFLCFHVWYSKLMQVCLALKSPPILKTIIHTLQFTFVFCVLHNKNSILKRKTTPFRQLKNCFNHRKRKISFESNSVPQVDANSFRRRATDICNIMSDAFVAFYSDWNMSPGRQSCHDMIKTILFKCSIIVNGSWCNKTKI